jgi:hypothetical protein
VRPRLAFLADLVAGVGDSVRRRRAGSLRVGPDGGSRRDEELSAEEVKRRLDASRERLKRETAPSDEG